MPWFYYEIFVPVSGKDTASSEERGRVNVTNGWSWYPLQGWACSEGTFASCTEKMNRILSLQANEQFCEQNWVEQKEFKLGFWGVSLKLEWNFPSSGSRAVVALTVLRWIAQYEQD